MDIEDILGEYTQHFTLKMADGFSEEEIANKLEKPSAIAEQFSESERPGASKKGGGKVVLAIGLGRHSGCAESHQRNKIIYGRSLETFHCQ